MSTVFTATHYTGKHKANWLKPRAEFFFEHIFMGNRQKVLQQLCEELKQVAGFDIFNIDSMFKVNRMFDTGRPPSDQLISDHQVEENINCILLELILCGFFDTDCEPDSILQKVLSGFKIKPRVPLGALLSHLDNPQQHRFLALLLDELGIEDSPEMEDLETELDRYLYESRDTHILHMVICDFLLTEESMPPPDSSTISMIQCFNPELLYADIVKMRQDLVSCRQREQDEIELYELQCRAGGLD